MSGAKPIAVLGGTGPEGFGLALRWAQAGETVIIGSRDSKRAQEAAEKIKQKVGASANISGVENGAACSAADLLVLTIPFEGHAALLKQLKPAIRPGSMVIDATVPLAASVGGRATRTLGVWQGSAAQQTAELVPKGISVVAAFQNLGAELLNADMTNVVEGARQLSLAITHFVAVQAGDPACRKNLADLRGEVVISDFHTGSTGTMGCPNISIPKSITRPMLPTVGLESKVEQTL